KEAAMKGDFTRDTFDPDNHFSRVLQQQGRVMLDADTNEQTAILLHYIRTLAADLIGPFAGPVGEGLGFSVLQNSVDPSKPDFSISKGRYYVDGILCENGEESLTYQNQKNYPNPPPLTLSTGNDYLIYLDVWERHINYLEDDNIREKALAGPDTACRAEVVSQVKLQSIESGSLVLGETFQMSWQSLVDKWQPPLSGCIKAQVQPSADQTAPCIAAPDAKYRGPENQLYRVEIHNAGQAYMAGSSQTDIATFKWSRDNGSVVTGVVDAKIDGKSCTVESARGFESGVWVEFTNNEQDLRGESGTLVKLNKVDKDVFTLDSMPTQHPNPEVPEKWPTKVRRWDQTYGQTLKSAGKTRMDDGTVTITESSDPNNGWIDLEDGLQIQFQPSATRYRAGDYWLIPARVATGDIEWPVVKDQNGLVVLVNGNVQPIAKPPFGIRHHYAPLALLPNDGTLQPLQTSFRPIIKQPGQPDLNSQGEAGIGTEPSCTPLAT
ncbi:MAG: DUF6519 domain-containing protein, partial [Methylococcales bacterium]|nr:DUF6519 domain-containing protein [Methylococcales bacterium]